MNWKRILRSCLCLIVVCCIILNVSPIKAEAVYMGGVADLGLSLGAWFLLQAAGVFFGEATEPLLNSLGDSFSSSLISWGAANGKVDSVRDFLALVALNGISPADKKVIIVPEDIMAGVVQWVLAIASLGVDVEVPSYSSASACPHELPSWDISSFPYFCVIKDRTLTGSASYYLLYSDVPFSYRLDNEYKWSVRCASGYSSFTYSRIYRGYGTGEWVNQRSDWSGSSSSVLFSEDFSITMMKEPMSRISYSNHDIYDFDGNIYYEADQTDVNYITVTYTPEALVGDNFVDGAPEDDDDIMIPVIDYSKMEFWEDAYLKNLTDTAQDVINGSMTHEEYLEQTQADASTIVNNGTLANTQVNTFINSLVDAIASVFVPSSDYISSKVDALSANYSFAGSIVSTAGAIRDALGEFETSPPIIYMELNAAEGSIYWGDRAVALDLRWYARYKPEVDALLSAVMYAFFAWRVFIRLSSIISGTAATFEGGAVDDR